MFQPLSADMTLEELFRRWPGTVRLFNERALLCPGCPVTPWHTLRDACDEYGLDVERFLAELSLLPSALSTDLRR